MKEKNENPRPKSSSNQKKIREQQHPMNLEPLFPPHLDKIKEMSKSLLEHPEKKEVYSKILESQCGAIDDSQPVEQYNGTLGVTTAFVNAHQSPVGQVQWNNNIGTIYNNPGNVSGVRWGTGTLISNDLLLTAGHLFDQTGGGWQRPFQNGTSNIISAAEIATNMHVNFNYQVDPSGNLRAEQSFAVTDLVEYRLGGLDFAIARLAGNPGIAFGTTLVSETDANVGDMVCIIGHPAGVPKRIEAGPVNIFNGDYVGYNDIDTLGGNSGSGILRASDGRIIGVHTNGGCDSPGGHNWGVRITSIITQSTTLQSILHPTLKFTDDGGQTTLKFSDDKPPLKFIVDSGQLTLKFTDDGGGQPSLKFFDDGGQPTLKFTDDGGTLKHIDDVKLPGYDKQFGDHKLPGMDGYGVDPRIPRFQKSYKGGGGRPFILATPHHSMAWAGSQRGASTIDRQDVAQYEEALIQLEQLLQQGIDELQALDEQYQSLLMEYEALKTGQR